MTKQNIIIVESKWEAFSFFMIVIIVAAPLAQVVNRGFLSKTREALEVIHGWKCG